MLNNTSSFYQEKKINFKVMGLDSITSDFLNWTLQNRDNLEFIKECETLNKISSSVVLHLDHSKIIKRIDDSVSHTRT